MDHGASVWSVIDTVAHIITVLGYVLVPFTVLKYLPLTWSVRVAGSFFFVTCAFTHFSMAFAFQNATWMVANHVVQAGAVLWFVLGFWELLREAVERAEAKRRGE